VVGRAGDGLASRNGIHVDAAEAHIELELANLDGAAVAILTTHARRSKG
jgi:hypothetical protein